jgi:hypothetical protein
MELLDHFDYGDYKALVTKMLKGGTLSALLSSSIQLSPLLKRRLARQIIEGVKGEHNLSASLSIAILIIF